MGCSCDEYLSLMLLVSAGGLIVSYIYITRPNLHGINFELGICNLSSVETESDWDALPDCSCGKGCSEKYPCYTLRGFFVNNGSTATPGIFYEDYGALNKHCLHVPSCSNDFNENANKVIQYYEDTVIPLAKDTRYLNVTRLDSISWSGKHYVNFTNVKEFDCWGYGNIMYFENNYSIILVYVSLIGPGMALLISLALSVTFGSTDHRGVVKCVVLAPFYVLKAIFSILKGCTPDCCSDSCDYIRINHIVPAVNRIVNCILYLLCCKCLECRHYDVEEETSPQGSADDSLPSPGTDLNVLFSDMISSRESPTIARQGGTDIVFPAPPPVGSSLEESDRLPPPPSYSEAMRSSPVGEPVPSYEEAIRNSEEAQQ